MKDINNAGTGVPVLDGAYMLRSGRGAMSLCVTNIVIGMAIVAVGATVMYLQYNGLVTDKNYSSAVSMLGLLTCIYGIYFAIAKRQVMVCRQTGSPVVRNLICFDADDLKVVNGFVKGTEKRLPQSKTQGNIMLTVFASKDGTLACTQVSKYRDLVYEPIDAPAFISEGAAATLAEFMKNNK